MLYTFSFFFSSKCSLFHNDNLFGSCIIHILYTGCAKIKKKIQRQRVKGVERSNFSVRLYIDPSSTRSITPYIQAHDVGMKGRNMLGRNKEKVVSQAGRLMMSMAVQLFTFYIQVGLKFKKKNNSGAKGLTLLQGC